MDATRIVQFASFLLAIVILALIVRRVVAKSRKKRGAAYGIASINADTDDPTVMPSRTDRPPAVGNGAAASRKDA